MIFLHLGGGGVIPTNRIIGIFDMDTATVSSQTRAFLSRAEKRGILKSENLKDIPKSFVLTDEGVCMSTLAPASLAGRVGKYDA
ncbi:MAG: DUF370 domain-containing protein [Clostridia bacterium]|nr:DUF370 domain-containing protein [Clostridia bacterium]MBQ4575855.1 DUF370 domain-containing protein [Clostridia bacterium]